MSIVAVRSTSKPKAPVVDTSSLQVADPWQRALAASQLIEVLDEVVANVRMIRAEAVTELSQSVPQSLIARHIRLTKQRVNQIIHAFQRGSGVAS